MRSFVCARSTIHWHACIPSSASVLSAVSFSIMLFCNYVHAQGAEVRQVLKGAPGSEYGTGLAVLGDWDGDGSDDFAVGAPWDDTYGIDAGLVQIVSGADLSVLWEADLTGWDGFGLGYRVADAGDVNRDGFRDLLFGGPGPYFRGWVLLYSGEWIVKTARGEVPSSSLWLNLFYGENTGEWLGYTMLGALNIDNDGYRDFLLGTPWYYESGQTDLGIVRAYSGFDGTNVWSITGTRSFEYFGNDLAKLRPKNDYDTDGMQDYLVGSPGVDEIQVVSSATQQILSTITFDHPVPVGFGGAIAVIGDTTEDGKDEFVASAQGYDDPWDPGVNGALVVHTTEPAEYLVVGPSGSYLGFDVAATGDVDGDAIADFVATGTGGAAPILYSGKDWTLLDTLPLPPSTAYPCVAVGPGDFDGDGLNDVLIGDLSTDSVIVYDTSGLVVPAFVDEASLIGSDLLPVTYLFVEYPAWPFEDMQAQVEIEYDHGSGFVLGYSDTFFVPSGDPPQRVLGAQIGHSGPFSCDGVYRYRVRMFAPGTSPGPWSPAVDAHPSADRNRDDVVDVIDLGLWAESLGTQLGDPLYDPLSDFDQDGEVNVFDLGYWAGWQTTINVTCAGQ